MREFFLGALLLTGLNTPLLAQGTEKERVVAAIEAVSTAIFEGEDVGALPETPELDDDVISRLKTLQKCRGKATRDSTLTVVSLMYVCGSVYAPKNGPVKIPDATFVDISFEDGMMTALTVRDVKAVSVRGN